MGAIPSTLSSCLSATRCYPFYVNPEQRPLRKPAGTPPCPCVPLPTDSTSKHDRVHGQELDNYQLLHSLGQGHFSSVFAARDTRTGSFRAVKLLNPSSLGGNFDLIHDARCEIAVLSCLQHPHIVKLHDVVHRSDTVAIVTELAGGGTLRELFEEEGYLQEDEARAVFRPLVEAVAHCHEKGVFHRDIKPDNVLLTATGVVKLADFGLAAVVDRLGSTLRGSSGTKEYMPPEVLFGGGRAYDGAKADSFSLGVVLYVMVHGYLPFKRGWVKDGVVMTNEAAGIDGDVPLQLQRLLHRLLENDPEKRMGVADILRHTWMITTD